MSMLDRPISEFDGPVDSVRVPVVPPLGECKPFQEVLSSSASRLKLPAFTTAEGGRKFKDYPDFIVNFEAQPGIGFLMGWRGKDGNEHLRGAPNPKQWEMYAQEQLRLPVPPARDDALHAQLEPRVPRLRQGQGLAPEERRRSSSRSTPTRCSAFASPRRARRRGASRPSTCASASRPTSIRCRSGMRRSRTRPPTARPIRSTRSRSGRWRCTTRGIRRTRGCARSTATTTCRSIRSPRARPASPTAAGAGSRAPGARCAACCATARRSSPARCGPGTRSARPTAPGSSRPAPTRRGRASC